MKGTLTKTDRGWVVNYDYSINKNDWETLPLHPDFIEMMDTCFTSKFTNEIEFEIVTEWENGEVGVNGLNYAKLINNVPDVRKMVEHDYIEELAKGEIGWYDKHDDDQVKSFISGYNKAKETLYTEEQVKQAINRAVMLTLSDKSCYSDEIIQSLKKGGNKTIKKDDTN